MPRLVQETQQQEYAPLDRDDSMYDEPVAEPTSMLALAPTVQQDHAHETAEDAGDDDPADNNPAAGVGAAGVGTPLISEADSAEGGTPTHSAEVAAPGATPDKTDNVELGAEAGSAQLTEEQMEELVGLCENVGWRATLLADGEPVACRAGCGPALEFSGGRVVELTGDQTDGHDDAGLSGGLALVKRSVEQSDWKDAKQAERAVEAGAAALLIANARYGKVVDELFAPAPGDDCAVPVIGVHGSDRDKLAAAAKLTLTVEPLDLLAALTTQLQQLPLDAMLTKDKGGYTLLHSLCQNSSLTPELLAAALEGLPPEIMLTKAKHGMTPLHSLCANRSLTPELLTAALEGLPSGGMLTKDNLYDSTPLHFLCKYNSSLTPELLSAALEGLSSQAMLTKDNYDSTPMHLLCKNSSVNNEWLVRLARLDQSGARSVDELAERSRAVALVLAAGYKKTGATADASEATAMQFWLRAWSPGCDSLAAALANNDTKLARSLVAWLIQPKGTESAKEGSAQPVPELNDGFSITPGAVPGLLDDLLQLYVGGIGALATDILRDHGLAPAGYTLNAKYTRVDLEDGGFAFTGSDEFNPRGITWSDHLQKEQFSDKNTNRKDVKPVVLAVCGAGHAGSRGLLHLLVSQPNVPVALFATRAVKLLLAHKWREFGKRMFLREVFAFVMQVASWQTLAAVVAQHGGAAVADLAPWQAVSGVLLAASSLTWLPALADKCLPLSPRTDISRHYHEAQLTGGGFNGFSKFLWWYVLLGWSKDFEDESRTQWSPLAPIISWIERAKTCCCPLLIVLLPLWLLVIAPGYYALALVAHCWPAHVAVACYLLGASTSGLADLEPASVAGVSIATLTALTALYIKQETRQLIGSRGPALRERCEEATANPFITDSNIGRHTFVCGRHVNLNTCGRILCGLPYLVYKALHLLWIAATELGTHLRDLWNALDATTLTLNTIVIGRALAHYDAAFTTQLCVVNTLLLWLRGVEMLSGFDSTAKYVSMLFAVTNDMQVRHRQSTVSGISLLEAA